MGIMASNRLDSQKTVILALRPTALRILEKRYLKRDAQSGGIVETPLELLSRVAAAVSSAERPDLQGLWRERFFQLLCSLRFLPNSPTLMNAGKANGQLSACFVLPVEDSLSSIFNALGQAAMIHQSGGGTGFSFSRLRGAGSRVGDNLGVASGPVSFLKIFDLTTETIKQGGTRRGANMGVLSVDHPDILEFIEAKRDLKSVTNFNLSVGMTRNFMDRLTEGEPGACVQFEKAAEAAWFSGDPGVVFLDQMNRFNPNPLLGPFEATNPCGEQPLLPYESCNLGSLNLGLYLEDGGVAWELLGSDVETAVRFLDDVIDVNHYPVDECGEITRRNRKIGLGVMGFADLLLGLGIRYGSDESVSFAEKLMGFIERRARAESARLAVEKGPFEGFEASIWAKLGYPPLRNSTVTTVAPTGTISLIAGCSSGIEPYFSAFSIRNALDGDQFQEWCPGIERVMSMRGRSIFSSAELTETLGEVLCTAHDLSPQEHLRVQAAFQRHCDSAVSKTINLPAHATVADVREVFREAYLMGCKGVTVYRDGCRPTQVLIRPEVPSGEACPRCEWAE
jgi:ribonucleoside-diphosphate reductase alpha chain